MKMLIAVFGLVCLSATFAFAQTNDLGVKLTGIIDLPGLKCVFLGNSGRNIFPPSDGETLSEGESDNGLEVLQINPKEATAEIKFGEKQALLKLSGDSDDSVKSAESGVYLHGASLLQVLDLYAILANRNVLLHPALPAIRITMNGKATTQLEATGSLERALRQQGIATIQDGSKFALIMPDSLTNTVVPHSADIKSDSMQQIRPGEINIPGAELRKILDIYGELTARKIDRSASNLPSPIIHFKTVTTVSREEAIYAFETLFAMNGVKIVPVGDNTFKALPIQQ